MNIKIREIEKGQWGCGCFSVGFITFLAFVLGYGAGVGHKDFSESLFSNLCFALFDIALWVMAILFWLDAAKVHWRAMRKNPTHFKRLAFYVLYGILLVAYSAGVVISLICWGYRTAISDTLF